MMTVLTLDASADLSLSLSPSLSFNQQLTMEQEEGKQLTLNQRPPSVHNR